MLPLQHPPGHEAALHTHWPLALHAWPIAQPAQAAPPVPHEEADSDEYASQGPVVPPLQHPFGHVFASQVQVPVVVSHRPLAQLAHAAPPAPHCEADSLE